MDHLSDDGSELRFAAYVEGLVEVIGHADRWKAACKSDPALGVISVE